MLKRYYNKRETWIWLWNYTEYYSKLDDYQIPIYENHP